MFHGLKTSHIQKEILVGNGDDEMEVRRDSSSERGIVLVGEGVDTIRGDSTERGGGGFYDDMKC